MKVGDIDTDITNADGTGLILLGLRWQSVGIRSCWFCHGNSNRIGLVTEYLGTIGRRTAL